MKRGIFAGAVLVVATLGLAACASSSGQKVAKNNAQKQQKSNLVCFTNSTLGSHIGHQVCMTAAQYKAQQKADSDSARKLREMQQNNTQSCSDSGQCAGRPPRR